MAVENLYYLVPMVGGNPKHSDKGPGAGLPHQLMHWCVNQAGDQAIIQADLNDGEQTAIDTDLSCTKMTQQEAVDHVAGGW